MVVKGYFLSNLPSKRRKKLLGFWLEPELAARFQKVCAEEKRPQNMQMEIILEEWLANRDRPTTAEQYLADQNKVDKLMKLKVAEKPEHSKYDKGGK